MKIASLGISPPQKPPAQSFRSGNLVSPFYGDNPHLPSEHKYKNGDSYEKEGKPGDGDVLKQYEKRHRENCDCKKCDD